MTIAHPRMERDNPRNQGPSIGMSSRTSTGYASLSILVCLSADDDDDRIKKG